MYHRHQLVHIVDVVRLTVVYTCLHACMRIRMSTCTVNVISLRKSQKRLRIGQTWQVIKGRVYA